MSVASVSSSRLSAAYLGATDTGAPKAQAGAAAAAPVQAERSVADHVAAQDAHEPIRSASTTQGTLVDTYL
ncbi:hypothetical protein [Actinoplanes sp. RD1]|uniref:hypothetical protein n=1 Tax=Actinoplanes sp. RD1 TaxID=3064538 RepID=UPI002740FC35|nr:hypothetical protein [Actinoplanes sp. RD1]